MEATATTDTRTDELAAFVDAGAQPSVPEWTVALTDAELVDEHESTRAFIAGYESQLRPARERIALIESVLLKRLVDRGATVLAHPDFSVSVVKKDETDVLLSECMPLFDLAKDGVIEQTDLAKALWFETPPPVLKKHLTHLKALGKKYGAPVLAILTKAIRTTPGAPKLVIEPKEREQKKIAGDAA